jgi:hypothetical protein
MPRKEAIRSRSKPKTRASWEMVVFEVSLIAGDDSDLAPLFGTQFLD